MKDYVVCEKNENTGSFLLLPTVIAFFMPCKDGFYVSFKP